MPRINKASRLAVLVVTFGVLLFAWLQRQALYDWYRLQSYQPPADVVALADATTMTDYARRIFYVNHPKVEGKTEFNQDCPVNNEKTIILGCYHTRQTGIFIYDVEDPELEGVQQVTAAHEALHAIYERLSDDERNRVDGLLNEYFKNELRDKRLLEVVAAYRKSEPSNITDEMHSIFGTEIANLPTKLEDYYRQYFKDRGTVVAFSAKYQAAFTSRQAKADRIMSKIKATQTELNSTRTQINNLEASLVTQSQELESTRHSTNDPAVFNAKVEAYNRDVQKYKTLISFYNQLIEYHNSLVDEYNQITVETNQLLQELNSRSASVPSQ